LRNRPSSDVVGDSGRRQQAPTIQGGNS
jgi:hypothetical protein